MLCLVLSGWGAGLPEAAGEERVVGDAARWLAGPASSSLVSRLSARCIPDDPAARAMLDALLAAERFLPAWRRRSAAEPPPPLPEPRELNAQLAGPWGPAFAAALVSLHAVDPEVAPWLGPAVEGLADDGLEDEACGVGEVVALAGLMSASVDAVLVREMEVRALLHAGPLPLAALWRIALQHHVQGGEDVLRWLAGTLDDGQDRWALLALADGLAAERDGRRYARRLDPEVGAEMVVLHRWVRLEVARLEGRPEEAIAGLLQLLEEDPLFVVAGLSAVSALRELGRRGEALEVAVHLRGLGVQTPAFLSVLDAMRESLGMEPTPR